MTTLILAGRLIMVRQVYSITRSKVTPWSCPPPQLLRLERRSASLHPVRQLTTASKNAHRHQQSTTNAHCLGCGASLQSHTPCTPGYVPTTTPHSPSGQPRHPSTHLISIEHLQNLPPELIATPSPGKITPNMISCQRCHSVTHRTWDPCPILTSQGHTSPERLFSALKSIPEGLILYVVDAFDFPGSLVLSSSALDTILGTDKRILFVGTRADLGWVTAPADLSRDKAIIPKSKKRHFGLPRWWNKHKQAFHRDLSNALSPRSIPASDVFLTSTDPGFDWGIPELVKECRAYLSSPSHDSSHQKDRNIYLIGGMNSGKSSLFNAIRRALVSPPPSSLTPSVRSRIDTQNNRLSQVTTSLFPGITQSFIACPFPVKQVTGITAESTFRQVQSLTPAPLSTLIGMPNQLIDCPSIHNSQQITSLLEGASEFKLVVPTKANKPRLWVIKPERSLFLGGLIRLDNIRTGHPSIQLQVWTNNLLPLYDCATSKADGQWERLVGRNQTVLFPPIYDSSVIVPSLNGPSSARPIKASGKNGELVLVQRTKPFPPLEPVDVDVLVRKAGQTGIAFHFAGLGSVRMMFEKKGTSIHELLQVHAPPGIGVSMS